MKDRIRKIMESQEMTQKTFAEYLGISAASLSSIFTEKTKPTLSTVGAIIYKFPEINLDWLVTGRGDMYKESETKELFNQPSDLFSAPVQQPKPIIQQEKVEVRVPAKREIKEIRIFFDDGTYETFVSSQK